MTGVIRPLLLLFVGAVFAHGAATGEERYQLAGQIKLPDRSFSRDALPQVLLEGTMVPFWARTRANLAGNFKFRNLHADLFTLIVYIPRVGVHRQTVEVSPGLADSKGKVSVEVVFEPNLEGKNLGEVSSTRLSIPESALKEYEKANKKLGGMDADGAIEHLKKTVAIAPQFVEAWNTLGTLAYKSGDFPAAENYFREALEREPDYYPSLVNLGGVLLTQGKLRDSLPLNLAAVQAQPDDALAHSQLGLNYYYLERFPEAEKHLKRAISLDPGHFSYPQLPLAEIYVLRQDFDSAGRVLDQFLALHPDAIKMPALQKRISAIRARTSAK